MNKIIFAIGALGVAVGAGGPLLLPSAPAAIQENQTLQPIGSFLINNGNFVVLLGLLLILLAVFVRL
jgi:hypothetical protein